MAIRFVSGNALVVVNIGIPDLNTVLIQFFYDNVVAGFGPIPLLLAGDKNVTILQSLIGNIRVENLIPQEITHGGRFIAKNHIVRAPVAAIAAVTVTHNGRSQFGIRHIAGKHGKRGDAAAIGAQRIISVTVFSVILLKIQGNLRETLMGDIRVKNIIVAQRIGSCGGFCQDNVRIGNGHGVLIPAGFHKPIQSFPGHIIPGELIAFRAAAGVVENMNAQTGAHNAGVALRSFRGENPTVQFGKERTLRHMPIKTAKQGGAFVG